MKEYRTIEDRLSLLERKADEILSIMRATQGAEIANTKLVGVSDIARMLGVTRTTLYTSQRYRLPNFGRKMPGEEMRWTLGEVIEWNKQPIDDLRKKYMDLDLDKQ